MKKITTTLVFCFLLSSNSLAQLHNSGNENSIFISGGISKISLVDKSMTNERYTGTLFPIEIGWEIGREKWINSHRIKFTTGETKNYSIVAEIVNFDLYNDYSYRLKEFLLGKFNSSVYLGPSTSFFFHYRDEIISEYSLMTQSFIGSFAAAINLSWIINFTNKIKGGIFFRIDILSASTVLNNTEMGIKMKLLFPNSALNSNMNPYFGYRINKRLSLNISYIFHYYGNNYWKQFKLAEDNLQLTIQYHWNK